MMLSTLSKDEIIQKYRELEKDIEILRKEKEALERELCKYKNPNTPPSAHPHLKPNNIGVQAKYGAKCGAPKGHPGTTRPKKEADEFRHITSEECLTAIAKTSVSSMKNISNKKRCPRK